MDSQRNDVSPEAMQARIQQARREAETLKDRIKRKKDELADTTCELTNPLSTSQLPRVSNSFHRETCAAAAVAAVNTLRCHSEHPNQTQHVLTETAPIASARRVPAIP